MTENNVNQNGMTELNEEMLEEVSGGKIINVTCVVDKANVRTGPGKEFAIIGHIYAGEVVDFKGEMKKDKEGKVWVCVNKGSRFGWVRSDLLKK